MIKLKIVFYVIATHCSYGNSSTTEGPKSPSASVDPTSCPKHNWHSKIYDVADLGPILDYDGSSDYFSSDPDGIQKVQSTEILNDGFYRIQECSEGFHSLVPDLWDSGNNIFRNYYIQFCNNGTLELATNYNACIPKTCDPAQLLTEFWSYGNTNYHNNAIVAGTADDIFQLPNNNNHISAQFKNLYSNTLNLWNTDYNITTNRVYHAKCAGGWHANPKTYHKNDINYRC